MGYILRKRGLAYELEHTARAGSVDSPILGRIPTRHTSKSAAAPAAAAADSQERGK